MLCDRAADLSLPPAASAIPLSVPNVSGNEWAYVKECLDTGWVSSAGAFVDRFERSLASATGAAHVVAVSSGTAALHLALLVSGIGPDDEVVLPALTFVATANAVRYVGAWPVFVDVDPLYGQLAVEGLEAFLTRDCVSSIAGTRNRHTGRRVAAVMPVDLLGHPADLDAITAIADRFGLQVIEDATESLGASCRGVPVGTRSLAAAFSFNGNKLLTTGGGGALVTSDAAIAARARYLSTQAKDDPVELVHGAIGFNYRLTNVQAAIGCAQLEQLDRFVRAKRRIADCYTQALMPLQGLTPMQEAPWARSTFWLYTIRVDGAAAGIDRRELQRRLQEEGIETRPLWQPLHLSPAHRAHAWGAPCQAAEAWWRDALSLPCSTALSDGDQARVVEAIGRLWPTHGNTGTTKGEP